MEKTVCNICNVKDCAYKSRNMEESCTNVAYYERGWDDAVEKAANFLNYKLDDVVAMRVSGTIIPHHVAKQELIEDLKNTWKENNHGKKTNSTCV